MISQNWKIRRYLPKFINDIIFSEEHLKEWQNNKLHHETYWGRLYEYLNSVSHQFNNVEKEWLNLNHFEKGFKSLYRYILNGEIIEGDIFQYLQDKNQYLQVIIDKYVTEQTDVIIDLGSGWGRQSIQLAFNNPDYRLMAGELAQEGQNITKYFREKYLLKIDSFQFNWQLYQPFIELLSSKKYDDIIIFTSNTIEQIPFINKGFFTSLITLPIRNISVIHIEPVGFQLTSKPSPFKNHYNNNLIEVLNSLESDNLISINNIDPQYYGHSTNTTAKNNVLIEWEKNRKM